MQNKIALPILLLTLAAGAGGTPKPQGSDNRPPLADYKLTFADEFDTMSIGTDGPAQGKKWTDHLWYNRPGRARAGQKVCWVGVEGPDNPFHVANGILSITARRNTTACPGADWVSGHIVSVNPKGEGFSQTYGYFEMKAKLPRGPGEWPAFWLMNTAHMLGKEEQAEIDILEGQGSRPDRIFTTIHTHDSGYQALHSMQRHEISQKANWQNRDNAHRVGDLTSGFHTYGLLWDARRLTFYVDRHEVSSMPTPADMHEPMFVIANLNMGGWAGGPDDSTPDPSVLQIDYIRVYSRDSGAESVGPNPERGSFAP